MTIKQNTHNKPLISIILPVLNGEKFLRVALDSMIAQTYTKWEMIVVDDGSNDETPLILAEYAKKLPQMRILTNKKQVGISKALNQGIRQAKGSYIARMDADDISYPKRFAKQLAYLQTHKTVVAVGAQCDVIDAQGRITGVKTFPLSHEQIYKTIFHFNPLQHPVLMVNRSLLPEKFVFYDILDGAEDVNLLFKLFAFGKVMNLDEALLAYRIHTENSSLKKIKHIYHQALVARIQGVLHYGYKPTIEGIGLIIIQTVLVTLLPDSILRRLYFYARGIKAHISRAKKIALVPNMG
ncbi:hypothetical protein CO051_05440 [Candidatus Roizmanbacteria bacterium CG_4_9_14_0_2_um_filter_39_13]|uniref:Glycosyltransferase 2-like domain-containing protein n=1 Tax=Candidatus Roizmanbacteria bacterium CG_4_9_14_0_2_um_filter_39_13 TaxID=1974839 RepID=A0A2M8EXA0_9BACT|nr:MAG: hypothetical protein CO051_05440 [Candidatus Roizmanbacteria bacterium CG_4_9_14_0_2_um_filter_39_13]